MFVLKELENSDARFDCITTNFDDIKAAQKYMTEQFEKLKKALGGTLMKRNRPGSARKSRDGPTSTLRQHIFRMAWMRTTGKSVKTLLG